MTRTSMTRRSAFIFVTSLFLFGCNSNNKNNNCYNQAESFHIRSSATKRHHQQRLQLPSSSSSSSITTTRKIDTVEFQTTLGIPDGLMQSLCKNTDPNTFHKRIWIVDNSGSMGMLDGHQVLGTSSSMKATTTTTGEQKNDTKECTRWKELEETVLCHAQLSHALNVPTDFRLLNNNNDNKNNKKKEFRVGYGKKMRNELKQAQTALAKTKPSGSSPLAESIQSIRQEIVSMLPKLKKEGSKVAVVIVTDGCNHNLENLGRPESEINQELIQALESLLLQENLPVHVVVRLCTDYGPLVDLYNELDKRIDGLDVIDDYAHEAEEVYKHNPWLNYALILHRMREMGHYSYLMDWLDERTFTRDELRDFCAFLFGTDKNNLTDPNKDWLGFLKDINNLQKKEKMLLNPITQQMTPWIDVQVLAMLE